MYTYHKATENGMTLHIIETDASNIRPVQLLKTSNLKVPMSMESMAGGTPVRNPMIIIAIF